MIKAYLPPPVTCDETELCS